MSSLVLSIGANIGDKYGNIEDVVSKIADEIGRVVSRSAIYESSAVGFESVNSFVNIALVVDTQYDPMQCLEKIWLLEESYGREKNKIVDNSVKREYKDRVMDVDIIFYDDIMLSNRLLTIPHREMEKRDFVLIPLSEIIPGFLHPQLKVTIEELKNKL